MKFKIDRKKCDFCTFFLLTEMQRKSYIRDFFPTSLFSLLTLPPKFMYRLRGYQFS